MFQHDLRANPFRVCCAQGTTGSHVAPTPRSGPDQALIGGPRLAGGARQPVRLQQHMGFLELRPQREADQDKGRAEQDADDHDASIGLPVGGVKGGGQGYPYPTAGQPQREMDLNPTE